MNKKIELLLEKASILFDLVSPLVNLYEYFNLENESTKEIKTGIKFELLILNQISHTSVVDLCKKASAYHELTFYQGIKYACILKEEGVFDNLTLNRGVIIPISTKNRQGEKCRILVYKSSNEKIGLYVFHTSVKFVWLEGFKFLILKTDLDSFNPNEVIKNVPVKPKILSGRKILSNQTQT